MMCKAAAKNVMEKFSYHFIYVNKVGKEEKMD